MVFNTGTAILDAIVLSVVSKDQEDKYGYQITNEVCEAFEVSKGRLYPILHQLKKDRCLEVYDVVYNGRKRRYYKATEKGIIRLNLYKAEWKTYSNKISMLLVDHY